MYIWSLLAFFLFFSGGVFKVFFPDVYFFHGQRLTLYISILVLIYAFFTSSGRVACKKVYSSLRHDKFLWLIPLLIMTQAAAIYLSSFAGCDFNRQFIGFLVLLGSILIHALAVFVVLELGLIYTFGAAWIVLFLLDFFIVFLQMSYQIAPDFSYHLIELYSKTLEARWSPELATESIHRFYSEGGSYVRTTFRLSGLTEEAPTHAIFIAVVFLPLALSTIFSNYAFWRKNNEMLNKDRYMIAIITCLISFSLIVSSSSTAVVYFILAIFVILNFLFFFRKELTNNLKLLMMVFVMGGGVGFLYLDVVKDISAKRVKESQEKQAQIKIDEKQKNIKREKTVNNMAEIKEMPKEPMESNVVKDITGRGTVFYVNKIKDLNNASTNSRLAMSVVDVKLFMDRFLFGVGRGCSNIYIASYLPDWTKDNFEIKIWKENGNKYPILNQWTNIMAEYGLLGLLLMFYVIYLILNTVLRVFSEKNKNKDFRFWGYSIILFFMFWFVGMLTSLYWRQSIYLQIIFVLLWVRKHKLEKI